MILSTIYCNINRQYPTLVCYVALAIITSDTLAGVLFAPSRFVCLPPGKITQKVSGEFSQNLGNEWIMDHRKVY